MDIRKKMAVMNWKCNPSSYKEAETLAIASDIEGAIICPPAVFLDSIIKKINKASLGSQDGFWEEGPYTGEYTFKQLASIGVKYSIIGHSERRWIFGETSEVISKKIRAAIEAGIIPILCIGEKERKDESKAIETVLDQLIISIEGVPNDDIDKLIIAYEPVWAIGTGENASLEKVEPVISSIINYLKESFNKKVRVLYGGSVSPDNIKDYIDSNFIDGVLVGGTSIDKEKAPVLIKKINKIK